MDDYGDCVIASFKNVMVMDFEYQRYSVKWEEEMERNRKEEHQKEDVKVFKETMKNLGIEQQEDEMIKSRLETSSRYKELVRTRNSPYLPDKHTAHEIRDVEKFPYILLVFTYRPGSEKWRQTLNRLRKWTTLPAGVVTELVDLVKNDKEWILA